MIFQKKKKKKKTPVLDCHGSRIWGIKHSHEKMGGKTKLCAPRDRANFIFFGPDLPPSPDWTVMQFVQFLKPEWLNIILKEIREKIEGYRYT